MPAEPPGGMSGHALPWATGSWAAAGWVLAPSTSGGTFELMRGHSGAGVSDRRAGWSAVVWTAVVLSGAAVRVVISANDSDVPFAFPLAAVWLVAAVFAVHWTACRWVRRTG